MFRHIDNQVGFLLFKHLGGLEALFHHKPVWNVQFIQEHFQQVHIEAVGRAFVTAKLVGREFPVTDNHDRSLHGVFAGQLAMGYYRQAKRQEPSDVSRHLFMIY